MNKQIFIDWFERLVDIWQNKKFQEIIDLCAQEFVWYETPFNEPLRSYDELLNEWQTILDQENIVFSYELVAVHEDIGIAHWHASFDRSTTEKVILDGIFQIKLNHDGKCTEFRQWYNTQ